MVLIVNWRGSDELRDGQAKAPTDTGLQGGNPAALDGDGRERLERKELALNSSNEDPCLWLRKADDSLAKFRPGAVAVVVNTEAALPAAGSDGAKRLRDGDGALVRFAADGKTASNHLLIWDSSHGTGGGWRPVPSKLIALNDVVQEAKPALGEMPIWQYAVNAEAQARFQWATANAHIKTWDSTRHWESGATVFHKGHLWRSIHDNSNVEPALEPGKVMIYIHVAHEPTFGIVPMGLGAAEPPAGDVVADPTHSHYAYYLQYIDDTHMTLWKFVIKGKDPGTNRPFGVWEGRPWHCLAWRKRSSPPPNFPSGIVMVWIYSDPGSTTAPVLGQQTWAAMDVVSSLMSCTDVDAANPGSQDLLTYDATLHKWVPVPRAQVAGPAYMEGTFTPTIIGTTAAGSATYQVQVGTYTRIGNRVHFQLYLQWSGHTGTGSIQVGGLPHTANATTANVCPVALWHQSIPLAANSVMQGCVSPNTKTVLLSQITTGAGVPAAGVTMSASGMLGVSGTYQV